MFELMDKHSKAWFLCVCLLILLCFPAVTSQILHVNEMKIIEEQPDPLKTADGGAVSSFSPHSSHLDIMLSLWNSSSHLNFSYCQTEPDFRLGSGSLLTYMMRLKLCHFAANRPWFNQACQDHAYDFTDYHRAVYAKFCRPENFRTQCGTTEHDEPSYILRNWMSRHNIMEVTDRFMEISGDNDATEVKESDFSVSPFNCDVIQSFFQSLIVKDELKTNRTKPGVNLTRDLEDPFFDVPFTEWFLTYRVFCESVACGMSHQSDRSNSLSAYDCFSACRPAIIFTMVLDSILAVVIVVANVMVLAVAFRTSVMKNIPGYFKLSLAISDLMVGLFVLPGSVYHHYVLSIAPLPYRHEGQSPKVTDYFNQAYLNFMGIFTVLSFSVSIYTMGVASVDRYLAITKPFKYRKGYYLTKKRCICVFSLIWFFGFIIAVYPVFTNTYNISALGLILSTGMLAVVIYAVTLGLPLLAVWLINGAMLRHVCKEKNTRRTLSRVSEVSYTDHASKAAKNYPGREGRSKDQNGSTASNIGDLFTKQKTASDLCVEDDVFEAENYKNSSNNCCKNADHKSKVHITCPGHSRFSNFGSSVHSQFKRKLTHSTSSSATNSASIEKRLAKTLGVMISAFTIAILPCILVLGVQPTLTLLINPRSFPKTYSASATNAYITAEYFASRLFLSNSFWNCIIYSIRNGHFRRAIKDVFICDEDQRRRLRHASMTGNSSIYRGSRNRKLSKVGSTNNGCVAHSVPEKRQQTKTWDLPSASRTNSDENDITSRLQQNS